MLIRHPARLATKTAARAGFTLMELLVVVAILVVLVGVATPVYFSYLEKSRVKIAKTDAHRLAQLLRNYQVENGTLPPNQGDWSGLPLEKPPLDPWGNLYQWITSQSQLGDGTIVMTPIVFSTGPNGNMGPDGECSSAN